jgi:uncharacterized protein (TIGR00725 family)
MNIAIFGSAKAKQDSQLYQDSVLLGRLLGERGHTVLTGGYSGTMEGASRGAAEAGAHVIGVTCKELEDFRGAKANQWVQEEWKYPTLHDRLNALVEGGNGAAIALPGGAGTLAEIIMLWNRMITEGLPRRPLVLIGKDWETVFTTFLEAQSDYMDANAASMLMFAEDVPQAITALFDHA